LFHLFRYLLEVGRNIFNFVFLIDPWRDDPVVSSSSEDDPEVSSDSEDGDEDVSVCLFFSGLVVSYLIDV